MNHAPPLTLADEDALQHARHKASTSRGKDAQLLAWTRVLERVVHLITKDPNHRVVIESRSAAPAWTDGKDIFLSKGLFNPDNHKWGLDASTPEAVLTIKGLVYHELGHVLLSDRANGPLRGSFGDPTVNGGAPAYRLHRVWNILEDGRQETLFVNRFRRAATYFTVPVLKWIVDERGNLDPHTAASRSLLITGRRYLPRAVRAAAQADLIEAVGEEDARELDALVTAYRRSTRDDWRVRLEVVLAVDEILQQHRQEPISGDNPLGGDHGEIEEGEPDADTDDIYSDPCPQGEEDDDDEAEGTSPGTDDGEDAEGGDAEGDDTEAEGDQPGSGGDTSDEEGDDDADADDGSGEDGADSDGDVTDGGDASATPPAGGDLTEEARRALRAIETSPEVLDDAQSTLEAISEEVGSSVGTGSTGIGVEVVVKEPTSDGRLVRHRVAESFEALRADKAPVTDRRLRAGRLNSRRYLDPHRQVHEIDFFDRRNDRGDGFDVELVVLVDLSGSMTHRIDAAAEALWATVVAADGEGIATTVVHFSSDDDWGVLKTPQDRWDEGEVLRPRPHGGTDPVQALAWTVDTLKESPSHYRLIVTITDGDWASNERLYRSLFSEASDDGINSLTIGIAGADVERPTSVYDPVTRESAPYPDNGHGAEQAVNVQTLLDLPVTVQQFVDHVVSTAH